MSKPNFAGIKRYKTRKLTDDEIIAALRVKMMGPVNCKWRDHFGDSGAKIRSRIKHILEHFARHTELRSDAQVLAYYLWLTGEGDGDTPDEQNPAVKDSLTAAPHLNERGQTSTAEDSSGVGQSTSPRRARHSGTDEPIDEPDGTGRGYTLERAVVPETGATIPVLMFRNVEALGGADFAFPLTDAQLLTWLYSEMGGNLQLREVADLWAMDVSLIKAIKQRMGLTHKSIDLIDAHLEEIAAGEIEGAVDDSLARRRFVYRMKRLLKLRRERQTQLDELQHRAYIEDRLVDALKDALPRATYQEPEYAPRPSAKATLEPALVLTDLHIGQHTDGSRLASGLSYGVDDIGRFVKNLKAGLFEAFELFGDRVAQAHVFNLGDVFDGIMPIIAPDQAQRQDLYGDDQLLFGLQLLEEIVLWMAQLTRTVHVWSVFGNHDGPRSHRAQPDYVYVVMRWLSDRLVNFHELKFHVTKKRALSVGIGNCEVILIHGTALRVGKAGGADDGKSLLLMSNATKPYRYVVHGHYHDLSIMPLPRGAKKIQCSAFTGGNLYSEENFKTWDRPAQELLVFDRERGLRMPYTIYLDDLDVSAGLETVEV